MLLRLLALVCLLILPFSASAQTDGPASLIADRILFGTGRELVAEGHVEVNWNGVRLTATRIRYDPNEDKLVIEGPIRITDQNGTTIMASQAEIDTKLQNGIMLAARMVIEGKLRLESESLERLGQRYTRLNRVTASTCQVCEANPRPLWEIRAAEVIHDQQEKQVWFKNAQLRVLDFPIFWLPVLRVPDPSVERASGFLVPRSRTSSTLGVGVKLPYFMTFGKHADFTFTPYVGPETRTLEVEFRRALSYGSYQFDAAISKDSIRPDETRAYLFGTGRFRWRNDYVVSVDLKLTSDPGYLLDYGFSPLDRLVNEIALTKTVRDLNFSMSVRNIRTLRDSELPIKDTLPSSLINVSWERRFRPNALPGQIDLALALDGFERVSDADMLGRDVLRAKADVTWGTSTILNNGMVVDFDLGVKTLGYMIGQDTTYAAQSLRVVPYASAGLRWPLTRSSGLGNDLLEPVVQVSWSDIHGPAVPNEDSTPAEFDEGNLLALSRFPGDDAAETGFRLATGLNWSRDFSRGWSLSVNAGRLFRVDQPADFSQASGLATKQSDWLFALQASNSDGLALSSRFLLDQGFSVTKASVAMDWTNQRFDLAATYDWVIADAAENRPDALTEVTFDTAWRINDNWSAEADMRFDPRGEDVRNAGFGVQFQNECVTVDLALSRRFTSSTSVEPTTDVSLSVGLGGFGSKAGPDRRVCRQ